jgi:hypothetical protein
MDPETVKFSATDGAAAYAALPAWFATIVQTPAVSRVTRLPLTVHTLAVDDAKITGSPDEEEALTANFGLVRDCAGMAGKFIDCGTAETMKLWATEVAGA